MKKAIEVRNVSKQYRLGTVGTGTLVHDLNRWWHRIRGKEDPYLKIGEENDRSSTGESDYVWALRDINFDVQEGEVVGIIGKNGAGKSTLLKILSQVTGPSTGHVKARGRIASLLEVGTGFHPELTGRENVFLNGTILGMTKKEVQDKLDEIISFAGVARYIDTPVKRYSSGMKVRLAFAVAAHLDPEILVVDEVLAVGDAEFQKKAIGKMQDVSRGEGRTVLFVSHNMASVRNLCSRGILLDNGKVVADGEVNEVVDQYLNLNEDSRTEMEFKDLGSDIELMQASVVNASDQSERFFRGDALSFSFELTIRNMELAQYGLTMHLFDERNHLVFVTGSGRQSFEDSADGKYIFRVDIPENIMHYGNYRIGRLLFVKNRGTCLKEWKDVLQFSVTERDRGMLGWQGAKEGVIGPIYKWKREIQ